MWPNSIIYIAIGFAHASIQNIDKIHITVVVVVVFRKIDIKLFGGYRAGVCYHIFWSYVVLVFVGAVVSPVIGQGYWANNIELWLVFAARLIDEILARRACRVQIIVVFAIEHFVHGCLRIHALKFDIGVIDQNQQSFCCQIYRSYFGGLVRACDLRLSAQIVLYIGRNRVVRQFGQDFQIGFAAFVDWFRRNTKAAYVLAIEFGIFIHASGIFGQQITVVGGGVVKILVAVFADVQRCAVRLFHSHCATLGRYSKQC